MWTESNTPGYIIKLSVLVVARAVADMQIVKETSFRAKFDSLYSLFRR